MHARRAGAVNQFYLVLGAAVSLLLVLVVMLWNLGDAGRRPSLGQSGADGRAGTTPMAGTAGNGLLMYCAAGIRPAVEQVAAAYEQEYGVPIMIQYGGSNTLLSQIEVARTGDLYLAADDSFSQLAREKNLTREELPLAVMRPVIAIRRGNPKNIRSLVDLLRDDVKVAMGNPDQAAIGQTTRTLLEATGDWQRLEEQVTRTGVFKPTVPEVANDIKLGSVDAGIVWDTTLALYPELQAVHVPALDGGAARVTVSVLASSQNPSAALRFARYLAAPEKGAVAFQKNGYQTVDGDKWAEIPEITFFCGSVNRRAVDAVIKAFQEREGVRVNTVYNGCGILTAQMQTIRDQQQGSGFPDTYMACDRYYLENVKDWFQEDVDVSDTEVVIAVPKGNPGHFQTLRDLTRPGVRIAIGQPEQCTIGVLTRNVLEAEGVYDDVMKNVVAQTASSAMLIPTVTTRSVDAALAYATDTRAEADKVDSIRIESASATAIQPFAIARSSEHKYLSRRLYQAILGSRDAFESAGFHFRLKDPPNHGSKKASHE
jgi:molybdenum ABC transporter molybdate-binding protein